MFKIDFTDAFKEEFFSYFENGFLLHFTSSEASSEISLPFWQSFEKILSRSQVEYYVGGFNENLFDGQGKYVWLSGRVIESEFEGGKIKEASEE